MGRRTRSCYLCGSKYEYCPTCSQDKMKPFWMAEFHSENCKNIFDICTRFNIGSMSKLEAQEALDVCDITNMSNFTSYVQRDISEIFSVDEEPKECVKKFEPVIDVVIKPVIEESHEVVTIENE